MATSNTNGLVNDLAYATTGVGIGTGDIKDTVGEMAYRSATQGFRDRENNSVYDNQRRISNIQAVMSLAMSDMYVHTDAQMHQAILNDPNQMAVLQNSGAFGNPKAFSNLENAIHSGVIVDEKGHSMSLASLSHTQIQSVMTTIGTSGFQTLEQTGCCAINNTLNGGAADVLPQGHLTFQAANGTNIRELATEYNICKQNQDRFLNATSERERAEVMRDMRSNMVGFVRSQAPELATFDGTRASFDKILNDAKVPEDVKNMLKQYGATFGVNENVSSHMNKQRQGRNLVTSYVAGRDMQQGTMFIKNGYKITQSALRVASKASYSITRNASFSVSKISGNLANRTGNQQLANMSKRAEDIATKLQGRKDRNQKLQNMNRREKRDFHRKERAVHRDTRRDRLQGKINDTKTKLNGASGDQADRLRQQRDKLIRKKDRIDRRDRRRGERKNRRKEKIVIFKENVRNSRISRVSSRVGRVISKPFKWVNIKFKKFRLKYNQMFNVFNKINPMNYLKKLIGKLITKLLNLLAPIAGPILIAIVILLFIGFFTILISAIYGCFGSAMVEKVGSWAHALENTNYVQLIVNDMSENLEKEYLQIVQDDAVRHYSGVGDNSTTVPSYGVDWTAQITGATLGDFQDEYGDPMPGIGNMMQIVSMMHYHMMDELTYTQYYTAEAYCYYLWLQSHHVGGVGHADYELKMDNFLCTELSNCNNVYYHDYDSSKSLMLNQARSAASKVATTWMDSAKEAVRNTFGDDTADSFEAAIDKALNGEHTTYDKSDFTDVITIPKEAFTGNCPPEYAMMAKDCSKSGVTCRINADGSHTHWYPCDNIEASNSGKLAVDVDPTSTVDCRGYEHTHDGVSCKYDNCTIPDSPCTMPGNCDAKEGEKGYHICNDSEHEHDKNCCDYEAHTHAPWKSESEPGCYATLYTCKGHCGGHATPVVNLYTDTDWETLMYEDCIQIDNTHWLNEDDFKISTGTKAGMTIWNMVTTGRGSMTLNEWENIWAAKIVEWFNPFPSQKEAIIASGRHTNSGIRSLVGKFVDNPEDKKDEMLSDSYGFTGWLNKDGSVNETYLHDLQDFYGKKDDNYQVGYQNWEEIGEVVFPMGGTLPLTEQTKSEILAILQSRYGGLSSKEQAIVSAAMDGCGKFIYSLQNPQEGHAESGMIDCSGFVASVLYHANIGWDNPTWTASSFASAGYAKGSLDSLRPGDVVAKNANSYYDGTKWVGGGSNHVVIYLGYFDGNEISYPGADSSGYYVIDCSSSEGGAKLRKLNIGSYERVYRP